MSTCEVLTSGHIATHHGRISSGGGRSTQDHRASGMDFGRTVSYTNMTNALAGIEDGFDSIAAKLRNLACSDPRHHAVSPPLRMRTTRRMAATHPRKEANLARIPVGRQRIEPRNIRGSPLGRVAPTDVLRYSDASTLRKALLNLSFKRFNLFVNLVQRLWWRVLVEVPGEWDLVADLRLAVVHPRIRDVRQHLARHVLVDVRTERNVLVVAQVRVRQRVAGAVGLQLPLRVAHRHRRPDRLVHRCRQLPERSQRRRKRSAEGGPAGYCGLADQRAQGVEQLVAAVVLKQRLGHLQPGEGVLGHLEPQPQGRSTVIR